MALFFSRLVLDQLRRRHEAKLLHPNIALQLALDKTVDSSECFLLVFFGFGRFFSNKNKKGELTEDCSLDCRREPVLCMS